MKDNYISEYFNVENLSMLGNWQQEQEQEIIFRTL